MNTKAEVDAANGLLNGQDVVLELECRVCHELFHCLNRTVASRERICTGCVIFGRDKAFHTAQLEAVKEYPDYYEAGAREKLEAYLRGDIAKWELKA